MSKIYVYKGTNTLDEFFRNHEYKFTKDKSIAECLLVGGKEIDLDEYPNLRGIFKTGVGTDNLPFSLAKERNIEICLPSSKTCEFIYEETASFTCYLILKSLYQDIGRWKEWYKKPRKALCNQNVLVVGKGKIGTRVFNKLSTFMNVDSFDIITDKPNDLKEKISQSDIITLHIPLNEDTRGMFNKEKLSWMRDGSLIVNTARAGIINESDLFNELINKRISCAIDVFWREPYNGIISKIQQKNVQLTPHLASTCIDFLISAEEDFCKFLTTL